MTRPLESLPDLILLGSLRTFLVHGVDVTGDAREHCALALDELEQRAIEAHNYTESKAV